MNKSHLLGGGLTLLASLMLAACNSNDDDNAAIPAVVQTTQVTVTPSLGKILNAKVVLKNAKTGAELGVGNTGNTGIATITATQTSDPVVAEVQGQADAKYFDESKKSEVNFAAGQIIRAVVPTITSNIGVTTLTEVAYQAAVKKAGGNVKAVTSEIAKASNEAIRKALAPELASITTAATLVGSTADLSILANTEAGKYALKLAALAELAKTQTAPALAILNQLAADITTDDKLDGIAAGKEITFTYNNSNLVSQITTNINGIITTANLSGVGFNVSSFNPVLGNITITVGGSGSSGSSGSSSGSSGGGSFDLTIETIVSGLGSIPIPTVTIQNIPKPETQDIFCNDDEVNDALPDGAITITACSFSGNVGTISVQLNQGVLLNYTVKYTYTPTSSIRS